MGTTLLHTEVAHWFWRGGGDSGDETSLKSPKPPLFLVSGTSHLCGADGFDHWQINSGPVDLNRDFGET